MAEHLNHKPAGPEAPTTDYFSAMGKPIPPEARQRGYDECKKMGLESAAAWSAVNGMAEQLERDKPYEAQSAAMKHVDLTGTYRLMAVLLVATIELSTTTEPA